MIPMTYTQALTLALCERYLAGLLDPFVSPNVIELLLYFAQEAGEALGLAHTRGPWSTNPVAITSDLFVGLDDVMVPREGAVLRARTVLDGRTDTPTRIARLISGYESEFGLGLLARVHWADVHGEPVDARGLYTADQIDKARARLRGEGWLPC